MNERILELAIEARKYAETKPDIYQVAYDKKFARLIVRECIAMADDFECDVNQRGLVDRMKQHFGVKE